MFQIRKIIIAVSALGLFDDCEAMKCLYSLYKKIKTRKQKNCQGVINGVKCDKMELNGENAELKEWIKYNDKWYCKDCHEKSYKVVCDYRSYIAPGYVQHKVTWTNCIKQPKSGSTMEDARKDGWYPKSQVFPGRALWYCPGCWSDIVSQDKAREARRQAKAEEKADKQNIEDLSQANNAMLQEITNEIDTLTQRIKHDRKLRWAGRLKETARYSLPTSLSVIMETDISDFFEVTTQPRECKYKELYKSIRPGFCRKMSKTDEVYQDKQTLEFYCDLHARAKSKLWCDTMEPEKPKGKARKGRKRKERQIYKEYVAWRSSKNTNDQKRSKLRTGRRLINRLLREEKRISESS